MENEVARLKIKIICIDSDFLVEWNVSVDPSQVLAALPEWRTVCGFHSFCHRCNRSLQSFFQVISSPISINSHHDFALLLAFSFFHHLQVICVAFLANSRDCLNLPGNSQSKFYVSNDNTTTNKYCHFSDDFMFFSLMTLVFRYQYTQKYKKKCTSTLRCVDKSTESWNDES